MLFTRTELVLRWGTAHWGIHENKKAVCKGLRQPHAVSCVLEEVKPFLKQAHKYVDITCYKCLHYCGM